MTLAEFSKLSVGDMVEFVDAASKKHIGSIIAKAKNGTAVTIEWDDGKVGMIGLSWEVSSLKEYKPSDAS